METTRNGYPVNLVDALRALDDKAIQGSKFRNIVVFNYTLLKDSLLNKWQNKTSHAQMEITDHHARLDVSWYQD